MYTLGSKSWISLPVDAVFEPVMLQETIVAIQIPETVIGPPNKVTDATYLNEYEWSLP